MRSYFQILIFFLPIICLYSCENNSHNTDPSFEVRLDSVLIVRFAQDSFLRLIEKPSNDTIFISKKGSAKPKNNLNIEIKQKLRLAKKYTENDRLAKAYSIFDSAKRLATISVNRKMTIKIETEQVLILLKIKESGEEQFMEYFDLNFKSLDKLISDKLSRNFYKSLELNMSSTYLTLFYVQGKFNLLNKDFLPANNCFREILGAKMLEHHELRSEIIEAAIQCKVALGYEDQAAGLRKKLRFVGDSIIG